MYVCDFFLHRETIDFCQFILKLVSWLNFIILIFFQMIGVEGHLWTTVSIAGSALPTYTYYTLGGGVSC